MRPESHSVIRLLTSTAAVAGLTLALGGCIMSSPDITSGSSDITGSISGSSSHPPSTESGWRKQLDEWGERYRSNPADANAAMGYAQALRATGRNSQAVAVLREAAIRNPHNRPLVGAYGRALADVGDFQQSLDALSRAHTPDNPDWRILNAQGAVLDQMGRHKEAQRHYSAALKIVPNDPSVLSNLGLSYALEKNLKKAEATLRKAVAQPGARPKVRQNLALVVGLEGRFADAEQIARADLPADQAEANVAYLRKMLAERNKWTSIRPVRTSTSRKSGS